jgi:hypothetical protein
MSILKYFNKHQGWHNGKRTPFGGGNPISCVTDAISGAIGTDGGGGFDPAMSTSDYLTNLYGMDIF